MIPAYREYVADPRTIPSILNSMILHGVLNTIPISSSEAEGGFSQLNIVCVDQQSNLLIKYIASLLFIPINGPPPPLPHLWNAESSVNKWLLYHRSATDSQNRVVKPVRKEDLNCIQQFFA